MIEMYPIKKGTNWEELTPQIRHEFIRTGTYVDVLQVSGSGFLHGVFYQYTDGFYLRIIIDGVSFGDFTIAQGDSLPLGNLRFNNNLQIQQYQATNPEYIGISYSLD